MEAKGEKEQGEQQEHDRCYMCIRDSHSGHLGQQGLARDTLLGVRLGSP